MSRFHVLTVLTLALSLSACQEHPRLAETGAAQAAPPAVVGPAHVQLASAPAKVTKSRARAQLSGATGDGVASGKFGKWRGKAVTIAAAWDDQPAAQTTLWSIMPGGPWGTWTADLDIAIGAIYADQGESWKAAAAGAYDARWEAILTRMRTLWADRPGTLHIRFAHEFNGVWVPWSVKGTEARAFKRTWRRFRVLQKRILPDSKLVFCPNDGSSAALKLDWRRAFPGAKYVDEMSVDSFNQYPFVKTKAAFRKKIRGYDQLGAPLGIERHRQFAKSVGLPMAVSEWSSNAQNGDGALFVRRFSKWLRRHAGTGPGQVPYEILFNIRNYQGGKFHMYPKSRMPKAAKAYRKAF